MATLIAPRYSAEDFETGSIRSAAPSYISEAPTYHSRQSTEQPPPSYTPRERTQARSRRQHQQPAQQQTIGLPPIPPAPTPGVPSLHNFNIPTWSTRNAQSANQLHRVIERRVLAEAASSSINSRPGTPRRGNSVVREEEHTVRPLEDPYLVGEEAAAQAKRERLAKERDDSILQMEEKQWDWLLTQMRTWDERERSWARFRRGVETPQRKNLLRRMGGRLI